MDLMKIGVIMMFAGGIISLENSKIGGYILAIGAICLIVQGTEVKKPKEPEAETTVEETPSNETVEGFRYKVVGNQVLLVDKNGYVIGASATTERKQIGNNKK